MAEHIRELIEIGKTLRVENGPRRAQVVVTEELLESGRLAPHYKISKLDAMGKRINLGATITYLDYYGEWIWYIYRWERKSQKWQPAGTEETKDKAINRAKRLRIGGVFHVLHR